MESMNWRSLFFTAPDGLKLHARDCGDPASPLLPVVCLAGLTRHCEDFDHIGLAIAERDGRHVIALDSRGRGGSDYDPNWKNYDLQIEMRDCLAFLDHLGISRALFLGTSRGGLIMALIGLARPGLIAGSMLNDIGPVIEKAGLERIAGYVGKIEAPKTFAEGAATLQTMFGPQFPDETPESWARIAVRSWRIDGDKLVSRYDRNIMKPLAEVDLTKPLPDLWLPFGSLKIAPMLVIRGSLSDLLSAETVREMLARHPDARGHEVPNQGHAPLLEDAPTIAMVNEFIGYCEAKDLELIKKGRIARLIGGVPAFLKSRLVRALMSLRKR